MKHSRMARSAALALTLCALGAPTAGAAQDLRNPDTRDEALAAEAQRGQPGQDLRNPDTRDAADSRGTFNAPEVTVVKVTETSPASGGFDWGDAGIGAGGLLGLMLLGLGGTFIVLRRRQAGVVRRQAAPTGG